MQTVEYKYEVSQRVYSVDFDSNELRTGEVVQVTMGIFTGSNGDIETVITYVVHMETGVGCSVNVEFSEDELYETLEAATAALETHIGNE